MNKLRFTFILLALVAAVSVSAKKKFPIIQFEQTTIDLGTFPQNNAVRKCTFKFKNVGKEKLVINYVNTSCGCTGAEYPKEPISPGATGEITVTYNGTNKLPGKFRKSIQIFTNCEEDYCRLFITGNMSSLPREDQ